MAFPLLLVAAAAVGTVLLVKKLAAPKAEPAAVAPSILPPKAEPPPTPKSDDTSSGSWYFRAPSTGYLELTDAGSKGLRASLAGWTGIGPVAANDGAVQGYLLSAEGAPPASRLPPSASPSVTYEEILRLAGSTGQLVVVDTPDLESLHMGTHDPKIPVMVGLVRVGDLEKLMSYENDAGQSAKDILVLVQ